MEATVRNLMQAIDSAVILVSEAGRVLYSNAAADRMMGRSLADISMSPGSFTESSPLSLSVAEAYRRLCDAGNKSELVNDGTGDDARFYWVGVTPAAEDRACLLTIQDVSDLLTRSHGLARVVSQISHDLRSPLTSVSGAAELLLSGRTGDLTEAHRRMVGIIDEGARKIETILAGARERFSVRTAKAGKEES